MFSAMKILLIYPYFLEKRIDEQDIGAPPMGLYYVGAMLKKHGHAVDILNLNSRKMSAAEIKKQISQSMPDLIGFSILHANRWGGIDVASLAREVVPGVPIVFGGVGATFLWKFLLAHFKQIDYAIVGEGEYPFLNLAECIEKKETDNIRRIPGVAFRDKGAICYTGDSEFIKDLDALPSPADYFSFQHLSVSRGCPENCSFCASPALWKRRTRFHSADYFVAMMETLFKKGVTFFYVSDDNFTLKKELAIDICRKIIAKKLPVSWAAISRADRVDEEVLKWMKKAGCIQVSYGIESGNDAIRKKFNKNLEKKDIRNAFALTTKWGMMARAYFIYGAPGETWESVEDSMDLMKEIKPLGIIAYMLALFPGTALYDEWVKKEKIKEDIWLERVEDILYFETDGALTREMTMGFGKKIRSGFYENLPGFVDAISLSHNARFGRGQGNVPSDSDPDFHPDFYADFYSRLAMTFSHGAYSTRDEIPESDAMAERLYETSLSWHPNHRAYLGLGVIKQKKMEFHESIEMLGKGAAHYPLSEPLAICLGISHMNVGHIHEAMACFEKFPDSPQAAGYLDMCRQMTTA